MVSGSADKTVRVWNGAAGTLLFTYALDVPFVGLALPRPSALVRPVPFPNEAALRGCGQAGCRALPCSYLGVRLRVSTPGQLLSGLRVAVEFCFFCAR